MTKRNHHKQLNCSLGNTILAWGALLLLAITLCGKVLISRDLVFGAQNTDIAQQFIAWRHFGFAELLEGRLPLWNPHIFAGAPYFGGFQSALIYPLNWITFLVQDTRMAINVSIAIHCFLMGVFTYHWLRKAFLSQMAAIMAGGIAMLCGTYIPHIYAGHLPNLCAMVWLPLMLWAVDGILPPCAISKSNYNSQIIAMLVGALAVAMQVLAGHPQYVLISAIAVIVYALIRAWTLPNPVQTLALLAGMAMIGCALAAIQLIPGIVANAETIRSRALPESFAAMFSLPVENLLTLLFPKILGDIQPNSYFGRWYFWEVCLYVGSGAMLLSLLGLKKTLSSSDGLRNYSDVISQSHGLLGMGFLVFIIALGANTPLHHYLYSMFPGFDRIRGVSKFAFVLSFVCAYFSAQGYDKLNSSSAKWLAWCSIFMSCLFFLLALNVQNSYGQAVVTWIFSSEESYFWETARLRLNAEAQELLKNELLFQVAGTFWRGGAEMLLWTVLFILIGKKTRLKPLVAIIVILQLFIWAQGVAVSTSYREQIERWDVPVIAVKEEYRVANQTNKNSGMYSGAMDISGNDPSVTTRYAELMAAIEGKDVSAASQYIDVTQPHPLHTLLRLKYVKQLASNGAGEWLYVQEQVMPRFALLDRFSLREGRDAVLSRMLEPTFDPRKEVVLEQLPSPTPEFGAKGTVEILSCQTDSCSIKVSVDRPTLLLMTDAWTPSWRVRSQSVVLGATTQLDYKLLPGNYAFRVVALAAGTHQLYIYYARDALRIGAAVSLIAMVLFLALFAWCFYPLCRRQQSEEYAP